MRRGVTVLSIYKNQGIIKITKSDKNILTKIATFNMTTREKGNELKISSNINLNNVTVTKSPYLKTVNKK
jgi:hypothetical protein